jgi:5-(carboxyamino)imidazole ribonucleotide mutase
MPAKPMAKTQDVAVIMGSKSDWDTMRHAVEILEALGISHDVRIVSAHRTPQRLYEFATRARDAGFKVVIAGAGGAAHLPGMTAALTPLPVFGVPVKSKAMSGQDSLYSIVQMPAGVPVGTLAIGRAGATNAALLAASVLALGNKTIARKLDAWRADQSESVGLVPTAYAEGAEEDAGAEPTQKDAPQSAPDQTGSRKQANGRSKPGRRPRAARVPAE